MVNQEKTYLEKRLGTDEEKTCHVCHKIFYSKYIRNVHEKKIHQKIGLVNCDHCEKQYTNKTSLICHLFSNHDILPKCQSPCCKTFKSFKLYTQHRRADHRQKTDEYPVLYKIWEEQSRKKLPCHICQMEISRAHIKRHIRDVHEICDKNLDTAPKSETLVYKFPCPKCEKAYKRKDHLAYHTKTKHGTQSSDEETLTQNRDERSSGSD